MNNNSSRFGPLPERNPFSTRATRPGTRPFLFPPSENPASLLDRLRRNLWWGEIVGPHGSGKSTLLHALVEQLRQNGRLVRLFVLHADEKRFPIPGEDLRTWDANTQVVIDGFEQLGGWNRATIKRVCRHRGAGLLVTTHEPVGLPPLFAASVSLELAQQLAVDLQRSAEPRVGWDDVRQSFERHAGNLREVFFELYDLYEARRPTPRAKGTAE